MCFKFEKKLIAGPFITQLESTGVSAIILPYFLLIKCLCSVSYMELQERPQQERMPSLCLHGILNFC